MYSTIYNSRAEVSEFLAFCSINLSNLPPVYSEKSTKLEPFKLNALVSYLTY